MEKMDYDDGVVVDLSISNHNRMMIPPQLPNLINSNLLINNITISTSNSQNALNSRRVLRPRTEPRSYVETPDVLMNGSLEKPSINGNSLFYSSDSSEEEMPLLAQIKELNPMELKQRERGLRRLREELRAEEMKLVLLKKLKQSQQLKENVAVLPPNIPTSALPPSGLPSGLSITPTTVKVPISKAQQPPTAHTRNNVTIHKPGQIATMPSSSLLRGPPPIRASLQPPPVSSSQLNNRAANLTVPQPPQRTTHNRPLTNFPTGVKDLSPSVTITPALPQSAKIPTSIDNKNIGNKSVSQSPFMPATDQERVRDEGQTPAQRQAAAKLALRKQLEKTLLQIPPPKPPPPEMHFIPNPSNTEFIYLVGLEHVIDYLTKDIKPTGQTIPFQCSQCNSDFTPVWKWDKSKSKGSEAKVTCEHCVTTNVKIGLKAEHTNRLKTAFVKALQQEQEIEQRLSSQNGSFTTPNSPIPSPVGADVIVPLSVTPQPSLRHAPTPPAPPPQQTPPPSRPPQPPQQPTQPSAQEKYAANPAAMQVLQQQLLRSLQTNGPSGAHMLQFSPLFYPYQLAMAQAASNNKNAHNLLDLQRAADLQRQYLLDMIPPQAGQRHNWKA